MSKREDKIPGRMSRGAVQRTRAVVERVEGIPRADVGSPKNVTPIGMGVFRAVVTTAIPNGSDSTPSNTGRVKLRHKSSYSGSWVADATDSVCNNDNTLSTSIPVGRVVKVAWISGEYWLISASCS
jgi:hypothetical protein